MQLVNILNLPAKYGSRYSKTKNIIISNLNITMMEPYRIFTANTRSVNGTGSVHNTSIGFMIEDDLIRPQSKISVTCNCKSFEFEVMDTVIRNKSLLTLNEKPVQLVDSRKVGVLMGCKHLIALARYIFERKHNFDRYRLGGN